MIGCDSLNLQCSSLVAFLIGKNNRRLLVARKMKHDAGNVVLHVGGQGAGGFNRLFKKLCHAVIVALPPKARKGFRGSLMHVISAQKKRFWINAVGFEHKS